MRFREKVLGRARSAVSCRVARRAGLGGGPGRCSPGSGEGWRSAIIQVDAVRRSYFQILFGFRQPGVSLGDQPAVPGYFPGSFHKGEGTGVSYQPGLGNDDPPAGVFPFQLFPHCPAGADLVQQRVLEPGGVCHLVPRRPFGLVGCGQQAAALALRTARVGPGLGSSAGLGVGVPPSGRGGGGGYRMPAGRGTPGTCLGAWRLPCIPASHDLACLFGRPQVAAVLGRDADHPGCLGPATGDFGAASLRLGRPGPAAAPQPRPQHPGGELQTPGETTGWAVPVATASGRFAGGSRRQLPGLTNSQTRTRWVNSDLLQPGQFQLAIDTGPHRVHAGRQISLQPVYPWPLQGPHGGSGAWAPAGAAAKPSSTAGRTWATGPAWGGSPIWGQGGLHLRPPPSRYTRHSHRSRTRPLAGSPGQPADPPGPARPRPWWARLHTFPRRGPSITGWPSSGKPRFAGKPTIYLWEADDVL